MAVIELDIEIPDLAEVEVETPDVEITPSGGATVLLVATPGPPGPSGPPGDGSPVYGETPTGATDGVNAVFTTSQAYRTATTAVYLNGLRETHYTESSATTITFSEPPLSGDTIRIDYIIQ
jgi:hypothetical protein